jgi:5'-3' exonuclease
MPTILLVDASPYIFRAYYSMPATVRTPGGAPANASYGFAAFLLKLAADEKPTHAAIAFDESLTTSFRNELYPAYKAQRALPPAELEAQLKDCQAIAAALGFACFVSPRYEADDLIASACARLLGPEDRAVVVTCDKDLAQLVTERITLLDAARSERLGIAEVVRKMGVAPSLVADFLGLTGDAVDNIPGVPGVGPKTAVALLGAFGSLDAVLARADEVPRLKIRGAAALAAKLRQHREQALLSRALATVAGDAPLPVRALEELRWKGPDEAVLGPLMARLGFNRLAERARAGRP